MINIIADNKEVKVKWIEFSDGALTCKIDPYIKEAKRLSLTVCPTTPVKQVSEELVLVFNALGHLGAEELGYLTLNLPYLPYGRADRVFEQGNPSPLEKFLNLIDMFDFDRVNLCDPHNPQVLEGMDLDINFNIKNQLSCFKEAVITVYSRKPYDFNWTHVIAPDKGAKSKAKSIGDWLGVPTVQASKERDISTGRITKTELDTELPVGSSVIIVDDILDGGGTFIPLAEKLRSQGCTVDLYITHLIAAKGLSLFKGVIDNIYCYQTVASYVNKTDIMNFNLGK